MSAEQFDDVAVEAGFVVRPDGTVVGDDGASGALAAALPYTGRLARRMGELVDAGDLRLMEAFGRRRLSVGVTWTPAGEGTFRAAVTPLEERVVPNFTVVGAVDTSAAVDHCLSRIMAVEGVQWSSVVTAGSRVIAARGERQELHHLAEVGNRMLAILRSLEDQHATGFMRLRFEQGAVIGASIGRHALVALATNAEDGELVSMIDEIRAILADHDLASVATEFDPDAVDLPEPEPVVEHEQAGPPPLVGARFGGQRAERKPRRSRFRSRS
ncbi:hypothetical protein EUA93_21195 [Nocardioides oleivorans]|uniref:Roadblock/LC7 domain-containing protein n=1 Tax=Nocardioides oleivorans TaxID=273676 RepID=A0A4Q2RRP8_9ACTN|nr:hypothetical protein [Nocardioides oleivorans]RYB89973.1 hypothetical protein EUA93_21195 [Nocardioides oleivorans]